MNRSALPFAPLLLLLLAGCGAVETSEDEGDETQGMVEVHAIYKTDGGEELLFGGLDCALVSKKPARKISKTTEPAKPLVFHELEPGTYSVIIRGKDRQFTTGEFPVHAGKKQTVRVDLLLAKAKADRRTVLKGVGSGFVSIVTAPVRLTMRIFSSDMDKEDAFGLEMDDDK